MTDNEIIKALECCSKGFGNCEGCPYDDDNADCVTLKGETLMMKDTIDLIYRQNAEIERYLHSIKLLEKDVAQAKSEAYREFAERFKWYVTVAESKPTTRLSYSSLGIVNMIDLVYNELTRNLHETCTESNE